MECWSVGANGGKRSCIPHHSNTPLLHYSITPPLRLAFRTRWPCSFVRIAHNANGPRLDRRYRGSRNGRSEKCDPRSASARNAVGEARSKCLDQLGRPAARLRKSKSGSGWTCSIPQGLAAGALVGLGSALVDEMTLVFPAGGPLRGSSVPAPSSPTSVQDGASSMPP